MEPEIETVSEDMSRRDFLQRSALAAGAVALLGASATLTNPSEAFAATAKTPGSVKVKGLSIDCPCHTSVTWNTARNAKKYEVAYRINLGSSKGSWKYKTTKGTYYSCNTNFKKYKNKNRRPQVQVRVRGVNGSKKGSWSNTLTINPSWSKKRKYWC